MRCGALRWALPPQGAVARAGRWPSVPHGPGTSPAMPWPGCAAPYGATAVESVGRRDAQRVVAAPADAASGCHTAMMSAPVSRVAMIPTVYSRTLRA